MYLQKLIIKYHNNFTKEGEFQQYWGYQKQIYQLLFGKFGYLGLKYLLG